MNLSAFNTKPLFEASTELFAQLGIKLNSNTFEPLPIDGLLKQHIKDTEIFKAIQKTFFLGIIDDSVFQHMSLFKGDYSYADALQQADRSYDGLMFFALELAKHPTRTEISELTRAFNRISQKMPVALLLKHQEQNEAVISITISERFKYKQSWRQGEKAGKVIILRDMKTQNTHAGHQRILLDLVKPVGVTNYAQLHEHWLQVLDVSILNKKFFQELANWYFWAMNNVQFPDDLEKKEDVRNATNLIRLITRIVFIWFIKEKELVPAALFNKSYLSKILNDFNKNKKSENYYHAILQNLFFGTLNQKMGERGFAKEGNYTENKNEYGVKNLFRYADKFSIPEKEVMSLFKDVPFLNGGLFDCLDKPNDDGKIVYVDGFSRNAKKRASVPDYLFFGEEQEVDLNEIYGTKNKRHKIKGLVNLLDSYKFTVAENTPIEEEVALDPELLGKVFENLLASYNPETQTTARKQTGSFYTPREIVNYMVDESLLEYLKQNLSNSSPDFESKLRDLFSYSDNPNPFDETETKALIAAINSCKILDPACGSGAFPMGVLHKMVYLLTKLDNSNIHWKELQRQKAIEETETAYKNDSKEEREKRLLEINDVFENNASDYGRKLYLIENCIYGIDIQPIAVQIAKLRFFISLIIDQTKQHGKENFGIRSLPNLETKFVAANTLIGLDKPQQGLLRNPLIEEKEKDLKTLRHNYFTTKTRKEKIQYQNQDKKLRKEIAKLLEQDGWHTKVAKQIVAFDPYDQNAFAPFFESEWMFGLTGGFDIVIGNPPWGAKLTESEKTYLTKVFPIVPSKIKDSYLYFLVRSLNLISPNACLSLIIPNTWLLINNADDFRRFILNYRITEIDDYGDGIFEEATVESSTLFVINSKDKLLPVKVKRYKKLELVSENVIDKKIWSSDSLCRILLDINVESKGIIDLASENTEPFSENVKIIWGIKPYQVGYGKPPQSEEDVKARIYHSDKSKGKEWKHLLVGGSVNRYSIKYENLEFIKYGEWLMYSSNLEIMLSDKILLRQTSDILRAAFDDSKYLAQNSLFLIHSEKYNLKYLTALLNSTLLNFIYKIKNPQKGKVFAEVKPSVVKELPIAKASKQLQIQFATIVSYIMVLKKLSDSSPSSFFERLLDAMVYELYLPEKIKVAGCEVLKHLTSLTELQKGEDEKNLKTIEKIYKQLSDPSHPISASLLKLINVPEVAIIEGRK